MSPSLQLTAILLATVVLFSSEVNALSCGSSGSTLDQDIKTKFQESDLVARGQLRYAEDGSIHHFEADGIWKGVDFGVYEIGGFWFPPPKDSTIIVYAWEEEIEGKKAFFFNASCLLMVRDLDYISLLEKSQELFGEPEKPGSIGRNILPVFVVAILFGTLVGVGLMVKKYVSLKKSFKRDA